MDYLEIVNLVFSILGGIVTLLCLHFVVYFLIGLFAKKRFPETEEKCKYGVVICARNEEKVIGRLIDSVLNSDYPKDKIQVFVVAHNCTDFTAEVARSRGAEVFVYDNPNERMKGYALKHAFEKIHEEYGKDAFDGFFVMDSDNIVTPDYISKMNDAFVANGKDAVITSYRNSKNFSENYMSCMYGMFFLYSCKFEYRGRTVTNCSTRVTGTGFLFNSKFVENGWNYFTLTEDTEFTADLVINGYKVYYCDDAVFYDEQPTSMKVMLRQRLRWAKGRLQVWARRTGEVIRSSFASKKNLKGKNRNIFSRYDLFANLQPLGFATVSLFILRVIAIAFAPLFGLDVAQAYASYFISFGFSLALSALGLYITEIIIFILDRKRIGKIKPSVRIAAFLLYPFFLGMAIIFDFLAMFVKNLQWKPIPHNYDKAPAVSGDEEDSKDKAQKQN